MPKQTTILLIRHGEKPPSHDDLTLSVAGQARAQAYVVYFQNFVASGSEPVRIAHLFATAPSAHSDRSRLTIEPLARALNLDIIKTFGDADYPKLAAAILKDSQYDNTCILIAWHHEPLLALAAALGVDSSRLPATSNWPVEGWPDDVFGWVLQLSYDSDGHIIPDTTRCLNQRLMYDDWGKDPGPAAAG